MSSLVILPGAGGRYESETFTESSTTGADTLDMKRCESFAVQQEVTTGSPGGDFQIEETFDDENWANLGSAIAVSDGAVTRFTKGNGPYGKIRINAGGITGSSVGLKVTIAGRAEGW